MNPINVEAFLAIANNRSLSKAAECLYLSQSAVSHRLRLLEEELECELVNRGQGQRQSVLTTKGEAFLPIAQQWMLLEHEINVFKEHTYNPFIVVGNVESMGLFFFDELYSHIIASDASLKLFQNQHNNEYLYRAVDANVIDIAFTTERIRYKNIITKAMFSEDMVLISSKQLELPEGPVHPKQLSVSDEFQFNWKQKDLTMWHDHWWNPGDLPYMRTNAPSFAHSFMVGKKCWMVVPMSMGKRMERQEEFELHELTEAPPSRICYQIKPRYPHTGYPEAVAHFEVLLEEFLKQVNWIKKIETSDELEKI